MKTLLKHLTAAAAATGLAVVANAIPLTLTLTATTGAVVNTITAVDNVSNDSNASLGAVQWGGALGDWLVAAGLGQGRPILGSVLRPDLDLGFQGTPKADVIGSTLDLIVSADGYSYTGALRDLLSVTSAAGGTVMNRVWVNDVLEYQLSISGTGAFDNLTPVVTLAPADILKIEVLLTSNGTQNTTTGDKDVLGVPDGGITALLLGVGLLGFALIGRRQKRAN